jgi:hypothetical protein
MHAWTYTHACKHSLVKNLIELVIKLIVFLLSSLWGLLAHPIRLCSPGGWINLLREGARAAGTAVQ